MKKIFTLFVMALVGLFVYAQDSCPTVPKMYLLNGDDAANVEIELGISEQNSANLNGFNFELTKPEAAVWKNVFSGQGYAPYILGCLSASVGMEFTDEQLEGYLNNFCDIHSNIITVNGSERLVIVVVLSTNDCHHFPAYPGKVGKFSIDMSALEDGEYEIRAENTTSTGCMSYTGGPEGNRAWTIDEPMVITLLKNGNTVIEKPVVEEYSDFYVVGTFNDWNQEDGGGRIQLAENDEGYYVGSVELEDNAEFKLITPAEDGWIWFGGADDNNVGYFLINNDLIGADISLIDGANFRMENAGTYTITVKEAPRGLQEPLVMTVDMVTGISTVAADKADNRIFDLQGRELQGAPEHGIYIQNGKKYLK